MVFVKTGVKFSRLDWSQIDTPNVALKNREYWTVVSAYYETS